ncbi:hypothetical protein GQ472_01995 [archaeon]|nr:hypothetical protein [archaeon]
MKYSNILPVILVTFMLLSMSAYAVPTVTIDSPTATTYDNATIDLNWSADETLSDAYYSLNDADNISLFTYSGAGDTWVTMTGDNVSEVQEFTGIATDSEGNVFIGYYDSVGGDLKIARWNGSWTLETVDSDGDVGLFSAVATDSNDYIYIAYTDGTAGTLNLAKWNGSWNIETVDSTSNVGDYPAMEIDSDDTIHISYRDTPNTALKYAKWNGSWNIETVDSAGSVGIYTSIATSPDNSEVYISYYDVTNLDLKFAKWNGTWNTETVDSTGSVGEITSTAVHPEGDIYISYHDVTNADLKFAKWNGTWNIETVTPISGDHSSMTMDSDNNIYIGFTAETTGNLSVAVWDGASWTINTVDSDSATGLGLASVTDSDDNIYFSYWDDTDTYLRMAWLEADKAFLNKTITAQEGANDIVVYATNTSDDMGYSSVSFTVDTIPEAEVQSTIDSTKALGELPAGAILGLTENVSVADGINAVIILTIIGFGIFGYTAWSKRR